MNLGDIIIIIILVVGGILFVAPLPFIYSLMKKRKKLLIGACAAIFIEAMFILFWASHQTYYKYNGSAWEVTNNMTRFYNGRPSDSMGGKMDISIDLSTGDIYQKSNANVWELKGNMRG